MNRLFHLAIIAVATVVSATAAPLPAPLQASLDQSM